MRHVIVIYRKCDILPSYAPGSDFNVTENGSITVRRPKKEDILYYVVSYRDGGWELGRVSTVEEGKVLVRKFEDIDNGN